MDWNNPWWLAAIPVLFGLGWVAARIDMRSMLQEARILPHTYYKGVGYLLNDEYDKAIACFVAVAKLDIETTELHFALGSLFRRRGEAARAIRVHQNLVEQNGLTKEQKEQALMELGEDYLKAGLLDRAENVFNRLLPTTDNRHAVLQLLKKIHVMGQEWQKAIMVLDDIGPITDPSQPVELSHFYCEQAEQKIMRSEWDAAKNHLHQAKMVRPTSSRAEILLGDICVAQGQDREAIEHWQKVAGYRSQDVSLIAKKLLEAYKRSGMSQEGMQLIRGYQENYPEILELFSLVVHDDLAHGRKAEALNLIRHQLKQHPTMTAMEHLLAAKLSQEDPDWGLLHAIVFNLQKTEMSYSCSHCGSIIRQFYWNCPACRNWETFTPHQGGFDSSALSL